MISLGQYPYTFLFHPISVCVHFSLSFRKIYIWLLFAIVNNVDMRKKREKKRRIWEKKTHLFFVLGCFCCCFLVKKAPDCHQIALTSIQCVIYTQLLFLSPTIYILINAYSCRWWKELYINWSEYFPIKLHHQKLYLLKVKKLLEVAICLRVHFPIKWGDYWRIHSNEERSFREY